jgi:hypothetical protein
MRSNNSWVPPYPRSLTLCPPKRSWMGKPTRTRGTLSFLAVLYPFEFPRRGRWARFLPRIFPRLLPRREIPAFALGHYGTMPISCREEGERVAQVLVAVQQDSLAEDALVGVDIGIEEAVALGEDRWRNGAPRDIAEDLQEAVGRAHAYREAEAMPRDAVGSRGDRPHRNRRPAARSRIRWRSRPGSGTSRSATGVPPAGRSRCSVQGPPSRVSE